MLGLSYKKLSIRHKLTLTIMLISSLILLFCLSIFIFLELDSLKKSMQDNLSTLADLVGKNNSGAILFRDNKAAEENLLSLKATPHIRSVYIFTSDFNSKHEKSLPYFAHYQSQHLVKGIAKDIQKSSDDDKSIILNNHKIKKLVATNSTGYIENENTIDWVKPIIFEQDKSIIGMIYIQSDREIYKKRVSSYWLTIIVIFIISIILTLIITYRAQKVFTQPLFQLLTSMKKVSSTHQYDGIIENPYDDEFGDLVKGFNEMLLELNKQHKLTQNYQFDLEHQVKKRTLQLQKARDNALMASRTKSTFLANMSHEIKTPMTAILGYTKLLLQGKLNKEHLNYLAIIDRSGKHLLGLINEILELSKMEAGTYQLNRVDFDLTDLVINLRDMFAIICQNKNIQWDMISFTQEPILVNGDKGKLNQVLINLIGNACKFTPEGEVSLSLDNLQKNTYRFSIKDTGTGINEEGLSHIFDAFHQEKQGMNKGGTGLGLNISQRHIELMSSKIFVESEVNKGSTFFFDLLLEPAHDTVNSSQSVESRTLISLSADKKITALVVDDSEENVYLLSASLSEMGCQCVTAENGQQAIDIIKQECPDIVFMDIHMPVMDGLEAIKKIRESFSSEKLKCIATSASSREHNAETFMDEGFDYYLRKPFTFDALKQVFNDVLDSSLKSDIGLSGTDTLNENDVDLETSSIDPNKAPQLNLKKSFRKKLREAAEFGQLTELSHLLILLKEENSEEQEKEVDQVIKDLSSLLMQTDLAKINQYVSRMIKSS